MLPTTKAKSAIEGDLVDGDNEQYASPGARRQPHVSTVVAIYEAPPKDESTPALCAADNVQTPHLSKSTAINILTTLYPTYSNAFISRSMRHLSRLYCMHARRMEATPQHANLRVTGRTLRTRNAAKSRVRSNKNNNAQSPQKPACPLSTAESSGQHQIRCGDTVEPEGKLAESTTHETCTPEESDIITWDRSARNERSTQSDKTARSGMPAYNMRRAEVQPMHPDDMCFSPSDGVERASGQLHVPSTYMETIHHCSPASDFVCEQDGEVSNNWSVGERDFCGDHHVAPRPAKTSASAGLDCDIGHAHNAHQNKDYSHVLHQLINIRRSLANIGIGLQGDPSSDRHPEPCQPGTGGGETRQSEAEVTRDARGELPTSNMTDKGDLLIRPADYCPHQTYVTGGSCSDDALGMPLSLRPPNQKATSRPHLAGRAVTADTIAGAPTTAASSRHNQTPAHRTNNPPAPPNSPSPAGPSNRAPNRYTARRRSSIVGRVGRQEHCASVRPASQWQTSKALKPTVCRAYLPALTPMRNVAVNQRPSHDSRPVSQTAAYRRITVGVEQFHRNPRNHAVYNIGNMRQQLGRAVVMQGSAPVARFALTKPAKLHEKSNNVQPGYSSYHYTYRKQSDAGATQL